MRVSTGGLPIGAVLLKQRVADVMSPGDHGSTFAGNPLVCAAAATTFDIISEPAFLESVSAKGQRLRSGLEAACGDNPDVVVRCLVLASALYPAVPALNLLAFLSHFLRCCRQSTACGNSGSTAQVGVVVLSDGAAG